MTDAALFHLLPLADYRADPNSPITAPTLRTEGFIHCSPDHDTTVAVANTLYRDHDAAMVVVELDPTLLSAPVKWEKATPAAPEGVASDVLFPHVYGELDRRAVRAVRYARKDVDGRYLGFELRGRIADELDLLPHPEGGWYRRTWASDVTIDMVERGARPSATAIYFLLPTGESSAWHTVASDELWMWHSGSPVTLQLAGSQQRPGEAVESLALGPELVSGQRPQAVVPAGTWQRAVTSPSSHEPADALVTCVVSPGFDFADFRAGEPGAASVPD